MSVNQSDTANSTSSRAVLSRWMVSKTSRFALPSDSFICSYYYGGVGACERARGGGRARKTGIQLAGTALTDRQV